jgi:PAS domain S-box-containing protein
MGALMHAHDWTASPLGPPETWPQSLRTAVSLLLNSKFPMFMAWGPELAFLYNDAYRPIFGSKHPHALGLPFRQVWSEIWEDLSPLVEGALAGEGTFSEYFHLVIERNGYPEDTWFTFSYSPVRDETGGIAGMFCACTETTAQVLTEAALRASEEQLRALADNLPYGMVYQMAMKRDGSERRFTFVSQSSERLSGVTAEAALNDPKALYDTILPEHHAALAAAEEVAIRTLTPMDMEVGFRRADGSFGWCRIVSAPRDGPDDSILWDGLQVDVTERKLAEAALRESEDHYRHTVELNPQVPWTSRPDGQLDHVSKRWLDWTGTSGLGETWAQAVHPDDLAPSIAAWMHAVTTGEPYDIEHRIRLRGGEYHWMHSRAYPRRDEAGRIVKWYGTTEDIQESKAAEERLRASEQRFRSLLEATTAVVWMTDADGAIVGESPSWAVFTGQSQADYGGWGWLDAVHPEDRDRSAEAWRAALSTGSPYESEYRLRHHDGTYRVTVARGVPITGAGGQVREWIGANTDITEQKRAEEHQNLLIHELNHRVKNTLATVQSIAAQTLRNASTAEQAREGFESRLLALSRAHDVLTRENWEGAGLREIARQAVEPYANGRENRLRLTGRDIRLTPRMALALAMALQELATNAVKYGALVNGTGEIEIAWKTDRKTEPPLLRLRWEERGGPPVEPPQRRGFGTRLIERSLAQDLNGTVRIDFASSGVVCTVEAPIA